MTPSTRKAQVAANPRERDPPAGLLLGGRGLVAPVAAEQLCAGRLVEDEAVREAHHGPASDVGEDGAQRPEAAARAGAAAAPDAAAATSSAIANRFTRPL
jgi:hypothetical protein